MISGNPKTKTECISAVFAQALTSLAFDYETEIFLMDEAVNVVKKGAMEGVKFKSFESIEMMVENFLEMDGNIYVCHPSSDARDIHEGDIIEGVTFVNASKLLESGKNADALFTF